MRMRLFGFTRPPRAGVIVTRIVPVDSGSELVLMGGEMVPRGYRDYWRRHASECRRDQMEDSTSLKRRANAPVPTGRLSR